MTAFSHIGLCVRDIDRSMRFYCDGLGFEPAASYPIDTTFGRSLEVAGDVRLMSQLIRRDDVTIELLDWQEPAVTGTPSTTRHQLGLTHLSFTVTDVETTAARLVELGGCLLPDTRLSLPGVLDLVFLADPDGTRVELMRTAG